MNKKKRKGKREETKLYKKRINNDGKSGNQLYKLLTDPRFKKELVKANQQMAKAFQNISKNFSKKRV